MADNLSLQKTLEQGRARFAYECAENASIIENNKVSKAYRAYTRNIPMLIKTNGLGATIAFIKSKSKEDKDKEGYAYELIYNDITQWLKKEPKGLLADKLNNPNGDLVKEIISLNSAEYRAVTNEVLAFFAWLKRFAEGLIEGESDG